MLSREIFQYIQSFGFQTSAYKKLLKKNHLFGKRLNISSDLEKLPIIDKKNYFYKYHFFDFFKGKKIPPMIYASSGSSGRPTFWFRGKYQEELGGKFHEVIFKNIFGIKKEETTLVVICFSMGVWVAGNYTLASCRWVAENGYNLSIVSPGVEKEDIFNVLEYIAPNFRNIILIGYPPFLMDIVHEAHKKGIQIKNKKVKVLTAGDKITESWRKKFLEALNIKDIHTSLISIYGCADAASLAHETPLSIKIRNLALTDKNLYRKIFGTELLMPSLVQYHPESIFFEVVNDEILITAPTALPLIRYNIHDRGAVFSYKEVRAILRVLGYEKEAFQYGLEDWKLPFIVVKGRTDVAVTFYAINIYPEHISGALSRRKISRFLSGNFNAYNKTTPDQKRQMLILDLELKEGVRSNKEIQKLVLKEIVEGFRESNIEFRKLYSAIGDRAKPIIKLTPFSPSFSSRAQGMLYVKGKKTRIVL